MRIGLHVSIAKSLESAALHSAKIGANTLQIFTRSPRMWRQSGIDAADAKRFREAREKLDLRPLVVHDNYLINLAAADPEIRRKSILAFRGEIADAISLDADYLVAHPGSYRGQTMEDAIQTVAAAMAEAARGIRNSKLTLLLENTAGQGCCLGGRAAELQEIRRRLQPSIDLPVAYCLDTAHCFAAGIPFLDFSKEVGFDLIRVIHANDSKTMFGSRVDRHQQIGKGHIGEEAFRKLLRHRHLRRVPFILETPCEEDGDDARNVAVLRRLSATSTPVAEASLPRAAKMK